MTRTVALAMVLACASCSAQEGLPAFPGAEGFGAMSVGGRGGQVIEVTTLAASGPGSLLEAIETPGPRIIVFRVGGVIELPMDIKVSHPFVTIAGQTAPGDGICLKGATLRICCNDVIVRYIRARIGDGEVGASPGNRDALKIEGTRPRNVIVDHCSLSWSTDELLSTWATPQDITIQWCIIAEPLWHSIHPKGPHGMGMLIGARSTRLSIHHNLIAHSPWRNPLIQGRGDHACEVDFRNNVIYNFGKYCTVARGRVQLNYVGNYIKRGADSETDQELHLDKNATTGAAPEVYLAGNLAASVPAAGGEQWSMVRDMAELGEETLRRAEPWDFPAVTTQTAEEAFEAVLAGAGATLPVRDAVDERITADVRAGTGAAIDSPADVGGWPEYRSAEPPADGDHDGMPDAWETAHGLNPADPADGPADADGDGYTNVEEYLNATDPGAPEAGQEGD
ncbi:MAG: pectate lyase [Armatimonadetes bacterium]|nr:pectate lyase [Armatimonadota bacterium]